MFHLLFYCIYYMNPTCALLVAQDIRNNKFNLFYYGSSWNCGLLFYHGKTRVINFITFIILFRTTSARTIGSRGGLDLRIKDGKYTFGSKWKKNLKACSDRKWKDAFSDQKWKRTFPDQRLNNHFGSKYFKSFFVPKILSSI